MKQEIVVQAIGDVLIDRPHPETIFSNVANVLRSADISFAQMEQLYTDKGTPGHVHATYSHPNNIAALTSIGLTLGGLASNHALDWGADALLDTISRLHAAGIATVGAGKDITAARQPVIFEKKGQKIAFLGYCCTGPDGYEASRDKPGFAPMRADTLYKQLDYQPGTPALVLTFPHKEDLADMVADIQKVKARVDVLVLSFHWGIHFVPAQVPLYEYEVAHAAIDAGADLIIGHHPHLLKGIEVYKGKVIFHSLGNFALELNPGWRGKSNSHSQEYMDKIGKRLYGFDADPDYPTVPFHPDFKMTMIVRALVSGGSLKRVSYIPCYINRNAEPQIVRRGSAEGEQVFNYVNEISSRQKMNVSCAWEEDEVLIRGE